MRPGQRGKGQQQPQQGNIDGADDSERGGCEAGAGAGEARAINGPGGGEEGRANVAARQANNPFPDTKPALSAHRPRRPLPSRRGQHCARRAWRHDLAGLGRFSSYRRAK